MRQFGEGVSVVWRGSVDIDMSGTREVLHSLKSGYGINSDKPSPNLEHKRTLKITEDSEDECKIDFYTGDFRDKFGEPETNVHFGIPLQITSPARLISSKLVTPDAETNHIYDIFHMLNVLNHRGLTPGHIADQFRDIERDLLINKLRLGEKFYQEGRVALLPSKDYAEKIFKELRKRRHF